MPYQRLKRHRLSADTLRHMLTAEQVRDLLGFVTVETVYKMARNYELPCLKLSGRWRFPAHLDRWLEQEMIRQMYARLHWRRPDDGRAHPPKDFDAGANARYARHGYRVRDLGVHRAPQAWHEAFPEPMPWPGQKKNYRRGPKKSP